MLFLHQHVFILSARFESFGAFSINFSVSLFSLCNFWLPACFVLCFPFFCFLVVVVWLKTETINRSTKSFSLKSFKLNLWQLYRQNNLSINQENNWQPYLNWFPLQRIKQYYKQLQHIKVHLLLSHFHISFPPLSFPACCRCSFRQQEVWRRQFLRVWTIWFGTIREGTRAWPCTCVTLSRGRRPCWSSHKNHLSCRGRRCLYLNKTMTTRVRHIFYRPVFFSQHLFGFLLYLTFCPFPSRCSWLIWIRGSLASLNDSDTWGEWLRQKKEERWML